MIGHLNFCRNKGTLPSCSRSVQLRYESWPEVRFLYVNGEGSRLAYGGRLLVVNIKNRCRMKFAAFDKHLAVAKTLPLLALPKEEITPD